jgi:hypothetical protein
MERIDQAEKPEVVQVATTHGRARVQEQTSSYLDKLSHYFQGLDDQHGSSPTLLKTRNRREPIF